jgi:hypothetical protein
MPNEAQPKTGPSYSDPVVLVGAVVTAFGLVGLVDTAIQWKSFFENFYALWIGFREAAFSLLPFYIRPDMKSIAVIDIAGTSIAIRTAYILERTSLGELRFHVKLMIWLGIGSTIYATLFTSIFAPLREAMRSIIPFGSGFVHDVVEETLDWTFLMPVIMPVYYIVLRICSGFESKNPEERSIAVAFLANTILVLGAMTTIILLCAKW